MHAFRIYALLSHLYMTDGPTTPLKFLFSNEISRLWLLQNKPDGYKNKWILRRTGISLNI